MARPGERTARTEQEVLHLDNVDPGQHQDNTRSFIILSLVLALSVTVIIVRWIRQDILVQFLTHTFIALLIVISITIMYVCWRRNRQTRPDVENNGQQIFGLSNLAFAGMAVFFIGVIFFDSVSAVATAECINVFRNNDHAFSLLGMVLLTIILKPVYMAIQIAFLSWSGRWQANRGGPGGMFNKGVFLFNGFTNITLVLYNIFYESRDLFGKHFDQSCTTYNRTSAAIDLNPANQTSENRCLQHTTDFYNIEKKLETYLFCFHAEFYVLATSLNLIIWRSIGQAAGTADQGHDPQATDRTQDNLGGERVCERQTRVRYGAVTASDDEQGTIIDASDSTSSPTKQPDYPNQIMDFLDKRCSCNRFPGTSADETSVLLTHEDDSLMTCATDRDNRCTRLCTIQSNNPCGLCGVFGLCLAFVYVLLVFLKKHNNNMTDHAFVNIPLYFFTPVIFAASAVVTLYLYLRLGKLLNNGTPISRSISIQSGVLIISAFGCNLFTMICTVSSIILLSTGTPHGDFLSDMPNSVPYLIDLTSAIVLFVQVGLQTKVLFYIHWLIHRGSHDDVTAKGIEQASTFLLLMNIAQWICCTFVESKYVGLRNSDCQFFGPRTWDAIIQTLFPFILYFRFHSTMAFAEFLFWKRRAAKQLQPGQHVRAASNIPPSFTTSFV